MEDEEEEKSEETVRAPPDGSVTPSDEVRGRFDHNLWMLTPNKMALWKLWIPATFR